MKIVKISNPEDENIEDGVKGTVDFLKSLRQGISNALIAWVDDEERRIYYIPVGTLNQQEVLAMMCETVKLDLLFDADIEEE